MPVKLEFNDLCVAYLVPRDLISPISISVFKKHCFLSHCKRYCRSKFIELDKALLFILGKIWNSFVFFFGSCANGDLKLEFKILEM